MNKSRLISIVMIILIVAIAVAGYFFLIKKPASSTDQIKQDNATQATGQASNDSDSVCIDMGLPKGSYKFDDGVCVPTEEHQIFVHSLAREENELGDERQLAFIKKVYEKTGDVYIDADYFQWLTSTDGTCVYVTEPSQTPASSQAKPECGPNGFLIANDSPNIRTFKLSSSVRMRLLEEFVSIPDLQTLTPREFMSGQNKFGQRFNVYTGENYEDPYYVPFRLILKGGEVIFVHQVYVP